MNEIITFTITVFIGFFAIMNPIANTPIFISLFGNKSEADKKKAAKLATLTAFAIVLAFVLLGKYIFELFGITIPAFKITGGILIFYIGFEMLMSKKSKVHNTDEVDDVSDAAISPLAIPILAGPGTIVTAMNYTTKADVTKLIIIILSFALIIVVTYLFFIFSEKIVKRLGQNIIDVISKIMGLLIAIIGTTMVVEGIKMAYNLN